MRLTKATDYAVRAVLYLAGQPSGAVVSKKEIARAMDIPDLFLGKIAQQLARAGIVEIRQGAKGGLRLQKVPAAVSLLEVIEAVMGEIFLNDCILTPGACDRSAVCSVHSVWQKARAQLRNTLQEANFHQLIRSEESVGKEI